ncbi:cell division protein DivIVA-like protein [Tropheryma whipplei str. Twist]|uniref:Cell wall synthesis protein Wag31 n=1 Tax=Tropheryma whipplei (strain Twist) TaxID=203267 RepID=Q83MU1_TROWT|nr:cell division protein DivIVA-like protein [Tropheryma whipplei str. Twist]
MFWYTGSEDQKFLRIGLHMVLSPSDIVNKRFGVTKFREGYDQDEVDDYLDEVAVDLRHLLERNDELSSELESARGQIQALKDELAEASRGASGGSFGDQAAEILALAKRARDEYIQEGVKRRDAIVAEARESAERAARTSESELTRRVEALKLEIPALEKRVLDLRAFESDYRDRLRAFLQSGLRDLEPKNPS